VARDPRASRSRWPIQLAINFLFGIYQGIWRLHEPRTSSASCSRVMCGAVCISMALYTFGLDQRFATASTSSIRSSLIA